MSSVYAPLTFTQVIFILGRIVRGWARIAALRCYRTTHPFYRCDKWHGLWVYCFYAKHTWQTCRPLNPIGGPQEPERPSTEQATTTHAQRAPTPPMRSVGE